jgi:hypothetical protein
VKYAVETDSGAMIYIPNFIKTGSGVQKLVGREGTTNTQNGDRNSLFFFQNKASRLKAEYLRGNGSDGNSTGSGKLNSRWTYVSQNHPLAITTPTLSVD